MYNIQESYFPLKREKRLKRIALSLLLIVAGQLSAQSYTQPISLNLKNATLKEFFKQVESKTQFTLVYRDVLIDNKKDISINVTSQPVNKVIKTILDTRGLQANYYNNTIVITKNEIKAETILESGKQSDKTKVITGKVTDAETGEAIIGASVLEKGTSNGVMTDVDGNFSLSTPEDARLNISYIGYNVQDISTEGKTNIPIRLKQNTKELDEVVVVGYGVMKKGEITGAISGLKRKDFIQGDVSSPLSLAKGKVAGLTVNNIGGDPNADGVQMMLRGVSNLSGNQQPLIVVDGIPGASLAAIAPDDVESIDVLKDGSAAAIYGTRGNNGVIIVTTKKGVTKLNKKTEVEYHGYLTYETIFKKIKTFNAEEFLNIPALTNNKTFTSVTNLGSETDWFNNIYQKPLNQTHNISIRSGNAFSNTILSVNYVDKSGILKNSKRNQLRMRLATNQSVWDGKLRFFGSAVGTVVNSSYVNPSVYYNTLLVNPTAPVKDEKTGRYTFFQDAQNPIQELLEKQSDEKWNRFALNGKITFEPISNLNLSAIGNIERFQTSGGSFATTSYFEGDVKNGEVWRESKFDELRTFELLSDYSFSVGNTHKFTFLLGYSFQEHNWLGFNLYNYNFPTELLSYNKPGLGLALKEGNAYMDGYRAMSKLISGFSRLNYFYKDKYFVSLSIRQEGSTKFGKNHKWGTFPAASLGWDISKEPFFNSLNWLDNLKLRMGYGVTGAEPNDVYLSINSYSYLNPVFLNNKWIWSVGPTRNSNPNLKWETKKEINAGFDYSFLKGKISGSVDFYNRKTDNLIYTYQVPVPPNLVTDIIANVGSIRNSGIEILLNTVPVKTNDLTWTVGANFSHNNNKVLKLSNEMYQRDFLELGYTGAPIQKNTHIVRENEAIGNFYGWKSYSISPEGSKWLDSDGKEITMENSKREIIGNGIPKIFWGASSTLNYKNMDLSISIRGVNKFQILNQYRMLNETFIKGGNHNYPRTILEKPYNVDTYVYTAPSYVSYYIENGDYLKLDNVVIGYTFRFDKFIEKIRLYVSGTNLYTFTSYSGIDPEINLLGLSPGIDPVGSIYPSTRSFSFGIQLNL